MDKCEVCGNPATISVQDYTSQRPEKSDDGKVFNRVMPIGQPHPLCEEHKRPAQRVAVPQ